MNLHNINNSSLLRNNYSVNTYAASVLTASQTTQVPSVEPMMHNLLSLYNPDKYRFDDGHQMVRIGLLVIYCRNPPKTDGFNSNILSTDTETKTTTMCGDSNCTLQRRKPFLALIPEE